MKNYINYLEHCIENNIQHFQISNDDLLIVIDFQTFGI